MANIASARSVDKGKGVVKGMDVNVGDTGSQEARAARLAQLEAFGQAFMSSFETNTPEGTNKDHDNTRAAAIEKKRDKKRKREEKEPAGPVREQASEEKDEMDALFGSSEKSRTTATKARTQRPGSRAVETVVFDGEARADPDEQKDAKKGWKAFMSSKIERIGKEEEGGSKPLSTEDQEEEKQMVANDRLLSELLSTTLFAPGSGTKNGKQNLSSSDTVARIMELSASETQRKGQSIGRGWGENEVKRQLLAKAPAAIRQGMRKAAGERRDKEREKAKELGTWHPSLKQGYSTQATALAKGTKKESGKRQRGIGVGIGKFQGGILKLSASEISKINGRSGKPSSSSSSRKGEGKPRKR